MIEIFCFASRGNYHLFQVLSLFDYYKRTSNEKEECVFLLMVSISYRVTVDFPKVFLINKATYVEFIMISIGVWKSSSARTTKNWIGLGVRWDKTPTLNTSDDLLMMTILSGNNTLTGCTMDIG